MSTLVSQSAPHTLDSDLSTLISGNAMGQVQAQASQGPRQWLYTKGASEIVLNLCNWQVDPKGPDDLIWTTLLII